jgi:hypothetical protein
VLLEEALTLSRASGDDLGVSACLYMLGNVFA